MDALRTAGTGGDTDGKPPPTRENRPADQPSGGSEQTGGGKSLDDKLTRPDDDSARRACRHVRIRFCPSCVVERRRASDELNAMYPRPPRVPCTFGLEPRELRAHARELQLAGWSNGELRQVLDVEPVTP
jgi:hypothetical protein